ncbi:MAG: DUF502 domain-containing protein [Chloroflexi bacterium]|nr:DUF502 domain-containing protein [Chloroflexota bacterium]MDA1218753.1 DUF502 domain-containing protein [Chloroflexota bacterium]PKB57004.1 MAG: hypothetical protein BZY73_05455 [SAR202 cluster bacterium Casp-Chloro-G3]
MDPIPHRHGFLGSLAVHIQTMLGAGLLVVLPIGVTIFILKFFFEFFDPILQPLLKFLPGPQIPGLGIITLVLSVYLVGLIATQVVGGRLINVGHRVIERIPVVKSIYSTTRTGVEILTGSKDHPYRGVVLVEFPRKGMKAIGLVTANLGVMDGSETVAVYIPTTPVPSSGFLVIMPLSEVTLTEMSVDDAMKMIVSGGILAKEILIPAEPNWDKIPKPPAGSDR